MPSMAATPGMLEIVRQLRLPGVLAGLLVAGTAAVAVLWPYVVPELRKWWTIVLKRLRTVRGVAALSGPPFALRRPPFAPRGPVFAGLRGLAFATLAGPAGAFLIGAGLFLPAMALGQLPLLLALSDWQARVLPDASPLVLTVLPALAAGLVQEPVKLAGVLAAGRWSLRVNGVAGRTGAAALVGAGFAAMEAAWLLSVAFATVSLYRDLGMFSLAVPVLVRTAMSFYHTASSAVLGRAWLRSPAAAVLVLAILIGMHALLAYLRVLAGAGSLNPWASTLLGALVALGLVGYSLVIGGPAGVRPALSLPPAGEP